MIKFEKDPKKIQKLSIQAVKENSELDHLSTYEKEIATQMQIASGDSTLIEQLRFSEGAIEQALEALDEDFEVLCDTESVACGMKQKYLEDEPICLINKASVISQAKSSKQTRSMVAVDLWKPYLSESFVVIGKEPTALFRLLELLEKNKGDEQKKPRLIIATPVGFSGAGEAKEYLWEHHEKLEIPCITLLGSRGGSDVATTAMNALLKLHQELSQLKAS